MAEAVLSTVIVGIMLAAALSTLGASRLAAQKTADRGRAMLLAEDLLSEILQRHYEDPALSPGSFGLEADEIGSGNRSLWDDVDDYHGLSESPPRRRDGTLMPGFGGWRRSVSVAWVSPLDLTQTIGSDQRVKRITVTVTRNEVTAASLVAVRTGHTAAP